VLVTAEYTWDLGNLLAAYAFVDAGRVYSKSADIRASDPNVGYGGGLQAHTNKSFLMRLQLARSRHGDVFIELAFTPAFGRRERVGRQ
jgi:hemolysin activation/secretion protein